MLETVHRDGRARVLDWTYNDRTVRTPAIIVPETKLFGADAGLAEQGSSAIGLSGKPKKTAEVHLVSSGTWFFPNESTQVDDGNVLIPSIPPAATTEVQTVTVDDDLGIWHDALGWASEPTRCVHAILEAHKQLGMGRALWAPGIGRLQDYAVWAYLGIDLFDASTLQLAAARGEVLSLDGTMTLHEAAEALGGTWDVQRAWQYNLEMAKLELAKIRQAIRKGELRALAERRAAASPHMVAVLRRIDRQHNFVEAAAPVVKDTQLACNTQESLHSPEVERFRRRLRVSYTPPLADILVLLPCSAKKPYKLSQSHRYFARALDDSGVRHRVHEVMVTAPLGLVPRELEDIYPANRYDVPVTGKWTLDEQEVIREQLAALLDAGGYQYVVAHVPDSTFSFLRDLLPDTAVHTVEGSPQSKADCDRMRDALRKIRDEDKQPAGRTQWSERKRQDVRAIASFQFGPEAGELLADKGVAHGRVPYVKLDGPEGQRAMTTADRGILSLTLHGARQIANHGVKQVHIQDFPIRKTGSLFAVGVTGATDDVRPGDDVVVLCNGELRACGIAEMSGQEMTGMKRGVAVKLRHIEESAKGEGGDE